MNIFQPLNQLVKVLFGFSNSGLRVERIPVYVKNNRSPFNK
ncbi:hypothetical protein EV195_106195 [Tenacibaculum skagerrakense]|uniref:Uncharacterized protein n=1 Tax=Tenacibaculum skagerrakense TaxID=186571 RepID=A0A4R2NRF0_9FLAO|nr:hypothetical protein [Tenacibaculum skagerrakense]TCP24387.1 hypothetical protein EV195_106195 [Tenacibaculum skagerrakense]